MGRSCQGSRCSRSEEPVVMDVEEKRYAESGQVACVKQQVKSKSTHAAVPGPLVLCQRCLRGQLGFGGNAAYQYWSWWDELLCVCAGDG